MFLCRSRLDFPRSRSANTPSTRVFHQLKFGARYLGVGLVALSLTACSYGAAEFQLYTKAFDEQYEHGQRVLDALARAERIVVRRQLASRSRNVEFVPGDAAYYLDNVDPPVTASVRASLKSLKTYNEAVGALANGEAATALTNRIGTLTTNIVGAIAASRVAIAGPVGQVGATALVGNSGKILESVLPILQPILTAASREAFREQLILAYPSMKGLLVTLREETPVMFALLNRSRRNIDDRRISNEAAAALQKDRELLAGWVLLLDQTLVTMETAVTAAMSNSSAGDLAALSDASIELKVLAEKIKSLRLK